MSCCCPHQELQNGSPRKSEDKEEISLESVQSLFLQYPLPYAQDTPTPLLVPQTPTQLHFGNPYSPSDTRGSPHLDVWRTQLALCTVTCMVFSLYQQHSLTT